jgi:cell wall-associated NlpC family hydrolase
MPGGPGAVTRLDVVDCARSWIGTPYLHQHRVKGFGVDCVGLLIGVCRELGLVDPSFDINGYSRKPDGTTLLARCSDLMDPVREDQVKPGHVLVIAFRDLPQHMGILGDYLHGGFSLIHAHGNTAGKGRVEEWPWQNDRRGYRPLAAFAFRGVR